MSIKIGGEYRNRTDRSSTLQKFSAYPRAFPVILLVSPSSQARCERCSLFTTLFKRLSQFGTSGWNRTIISEHIRLLPLTNQPPKHKFCVTFISTWRDQPCSPSNYSVYSRGTQCRYVGKKLGGSNHRATPLHYRIPTTEASLYITT